MSRRRTRTFGYVLIGLIAGVALVLATLYILTRTEFGVEQVRRVAVSQIQQRIAGELRVGRIEAAPGLLGGAVLHDVEIDDEAGRPFLRADSLRLAYNWRVLIGGRIEFDRADIYGAEVVIERLPGDTLWNYERIFPDTEPDLGPEGPDRLIQIQRARIFDSRFVLRFPWEPDEPVTAEDAERLILREAPGGLQREFRFENINANLPRVLWESPVEEGRLFQVASLSTLGYIWTDPFDLRDMRGTVTQRDTVIAFDVDHFRLPETVGSGLGRIVVGDERVLVDISIQGDEVAMRDLQWLYPPLPDEGGGTLDFRIQTQPVGTLWLARDARISAPGTELAGSFGIVTGDTLYFTRVDLRAASLDVDLLESLLPIDLPLDGLLVGTVEVEGPISSLTTRGDLRLAGGAAGHGPAAVQWAGTFDLRAPFAVQNLRADVRSLDLARFQTHWPGLAAAGRVSGRVEATGQLDRSVHFTARLQHELQGLEPSVFEGSGTVAVDGRASRLDIELLAERFALETVGAFVPAATKWRGRVGGPLTVTGPLDDLAVLAELTTDAGRVRLEGRADLAAETPTYRLEGRIDDFDLSTLLADAPETAVQTRFALEGQGRRPDSIRALAVLELDSGRVGDVELRAGQLRLGLEDGVVLVDTLMLEVEAGRVEASGSIGLIADQRGRMQLRVHADSLSPLRGLVFPNAGTPVDEDDGHRLEGRGRIDAMLAGSLADLSIFGEASLHEFVYDHSGARSVGVTFRAAGIGTDAPSYRIHGTADSLAIFHQHLGGATITLGYEDGRGELVGNAWASEPESSEYRLVTGYRLAGEGLDLDVTEVRVRTGEEDWRLSAPAYLHLGDNGVVVNELRFARANGPGSIRATGRLPWRQEDAAGEEARDQDLAAGFQLIVDRLPIFALRRGPDLEPAALATLTGRVLVGGTASAPRIEADLGLTDVRIGDVRLDRLDSRLSYSDRLLDTSLHAWLRGQRVLGGQGWVPLDLRLTPVAERRLAEPLDFVVRANGMPATILTSFVDGFQDVQGTVNGVVTVGGTTLEPELGGELELANGEATWAMTGVRYRDVRGTFRVLGEQVVAVEASARAGAGSANIGGVITFRPLSDPEFNLRVTAREFEASRRRDVEAVGTGEVRLTGRFTRPVLQGELRVDRGALYVDEIVRQGQIVALDDEFLLTAAVDTSAGALRRIRPFLTSPFLKNLVITDAQLSVDRDTWLRGRNLNVEVTGGLQVQLDMSREDLRLTGSLQAIRGFYELYFAEAMPVRRFSVRDGSVDFDGTPGINPALNITTAYRVRTQRSEPLNVLAVVTGNLQSPRVSLRSDVEPPISESDLMSYVIFGRPTYELAGPENQQLGTALALTNLSVGVLERSVLGYAAAGLESVVSNLGILDYVAITEADGAWRPDDEGVGFNLFARSQVEVGRYLGENWYIALTRRFTDRGFGGRLEWRFLPTWTAELFYEDRFARLAPFGFPQTFGEGDKVRGFFLFREWGY